MILPEFLPLEPFQGIPLAISPNEHIKLILSNGMILGRDLGPPPSVLLGLNKLLKPHIGKHLHPEQQTHLEQNALQLSNTNVVDGAGAELAVELFGPHTSEVMDVVRPQMEDIVSGKAIPLFDHHHFGSEKLRFYGCPQTAWTRADHQHALSRAGAAAFVNL